MKGIEDNKKEEKPKANAFFNTNQKFNERKGRDSASNESGSHEYQCMLCGLNNTHKSDDCCILERQVKNIKFTYDAQTHQGKKQFRKREEINAIAESVAEMMQKQRLEKRALEKRKRESDQELQNTKRHFETLNISGDSFSDESDDE